MNLNKYDQLRADVDGFSTHEQRPDLGTIKDSIRIKGYSLVGACITRFYEDGPSTVNLLASKADKKGTTREGDFLSLIRYISSTNYLIEHAPLV